MEFLGKSKGSKELISFVKDRKGHDFRYALNSSKIKNLGWKSITISQSDIASMGAQPIYSVINLCIPNDLSLNNIKDLYKGMVQATNKFGGQIVGGDTVRSNKIIISVTMVGIFMPILAVFQMPLKVRINIKDC